MKIKIPMAEFIRAQLKGPTAFAIMLESKGLDPYKRPMDYLVDDTEHVVEVKQ